jgi:glycosyltransferase involved in cell wall biosynthesis
VVGGPIYQTDGSQVDLDELRARCEALGLGARVGFTGHVADSSSAMRALDVVVHASTDPEPFGLVIAEAMACGKAVVASEGGGATELSGTIGVPTHPAGDAEALARSIEQLAVDRGRRERLGAAGRTAAERYFTRSRMVAELMPIYAGVASVR